MGSLGYRILKVVPRLFRTVIFFFLFFLVSHVKKRWVMERSFGQLQIRSPIRRFAKFGECDEFIEIRTIRSTAANSCRRLISVWAVSPKMIFSKSTHSFIGMEIPIFLSSVYSRFLALNLSCVKRALDTWPVSVSAPLRVSQFLPRGWASAHRPDRRYQNCYFGYGQILRWNVPFLQLLKVCRLTHR